jgi:transcriptional regulator with XRE-family HTH domain
VGQARSLQAFLHDLRALRERQGLSIADLAQRTHFPAETLEAAEAGPGRPALPVVEAYVRACGQEPDAWEDRWRALPAEFTITRLGRDGRRRPLVMLALAAGIVAVAAGGSTLLVLRPASHEATWKTPRHVTRPPASAPVATPPPPSHPAAPAPRPRQAPSTAPAQQVATGPQVTGFGCPQGEGEGVNVDNASTGPGWAVADDGWTGNGCDGGSVWTMNPNGNQPVSSILTWVFAPPAKATSCTVAVFVPAQNALGVADYAISAGTASVATVAVDQAPAAGQWVTLGRYQVNGSPLDVQISPDLARLTAPGDGRGHNSAIGASAASATCG